MREHYGPGYRIIYTLIGKKLIVLLVGSSKKDRKKAIAEAKNYLADYADKEVTMKKKPTRPFNKTSQQLLKDPKVAAEYLEDILADGNMELFTAALKDVADACLGGMSALSKKTDLNRQQLYKTLSKNGNPRLNTLKEVLHAVGLRVSVTPDARL